MKAVGCCRLLHCNGDFFFLQYKDKNFLFPSFSITSASVLIFPDANWSIQLFYCLFRKQWGEKKKKKDLGRVESSQHRWRQASLHLIGREGESINWSSCLCLHETRLSKAIKRDHLALKSLSGSLSCACVCVPKRSWTVVVLQPCDPSRSSQTLLCLRRSAVPLHPVVT